MAEAERHSERHSKQKKASMKWDESPGEKMRVHKCFAAKRVKTKKRYTQSTSKGIISCYTDKTKSWSYPA